MTTKEILAIQMEENDAGAATIGEYLGCLLVKVWEDREGFNGKRPFGNSGWEYEIYDTLVRAKLVDGTIDEDGDILNIDYKKADELITNCIAEVFSM